MIIRKIAILALLLLSVCEISTAQTTITFEVPEGKNVIDSIKIQSFTNNKEWTIPFTNNVHISFPEKYPDLYTFRYVEGNKTRKRWEYWIDTGNIKIVVKGGDAGDSAYRTVTDTVIGSPLTYKAIDFWKQYRSLVNANDTAALNEYLVRTYKENMNNPFSFVAGKHFYECHCGAFTQISSLDELQNDIIKENAFYALMLRNRLRSFQFSFIHFFNEQSFKKIRGGKTKGRFRRSNPGIVFFLNTKTPTSLQELTNLEKALPRIISEEIYLLIAVNKAHYPAWKNRLKKLKFKNIILVDGDALLKQTTFYPLTKFYFIEFGSMITGYYDSFDDVKKIYSSHYEGSL
ncbi:hypothetical protein L3C95_15750 [Chitinophaga filiformis]|uniref:hypothetical protein n=1 Tax=Chitinophaga filiformis TaxID=104663 RepID=UPI001F3F01F5|nr:hypothetical protein [Chitinophaga filiformis]MCF6404351.1 hypothetical protein [Chitinophaga filiformis]